MGGFPALRRDVLRWLITLNLSQPIKNVRRDFSNGFLVAEIFSQYYPQEIQMHSFDNGTKLAKKRDNWAQLEKLFRKKEFTVLPGEIDNIINCGPGDGIGPLLERMYWFLARKSCKPQEPHIQDLWTGLPDSSETSLISNTGRLEKNGCQSSEDESFFHELHSSINSINSISYQIPSSTSEKDHFRFKDATDSSVDGLLERSFPFRNSSKKPNPFLANGEAEDPTDDTQAPLSDRKQGNIDVDYQTRKKPTLNAVERARQKEMKEMSKAKSPPRVVKQARESLPTLDTLQDPRLAFRSPNRQRHFKSYTLMDYKRQQALGYVVLGKLGPDSTDELRAKRDTLEKMKEFGRSARSIVASHIVEPRKPKEKPLSTREKALRFASTVPKPKKKDVQKEDMQENQQPAAQPMTELEILEAKYQTDKQHLEAMRRDLEIFLR